MLHLQLSPNEQSFLVSKKCRQTGPLRIDIDLSTDRTWRSIPYRYLKTVIRLPRSWLPLVRRGPTEKLYVRYAMVSQSQMSYSRSLNNCQIEFNPGSSQQPSPGNEQTMAHRYAQAPRPRSHRFTTLTSPHRAAYRRSDAHPRQASVELRSRSALFLVTKGHQPSPEPSSSRTANRLWLILVLAAAAVFCCSLL